MSRTFAALCITLGALISVDVHAKDPLSFLHGEWSGAGNTSGSSSIIRHVWAPAFGGQYSRLDLSAHLTGKDGQKTLFEGIGYYRAIGDKAFDGFWIDSSGDLQPLRATLEDQTLTAIWDEAGAMPGRSVYQLMPDATLLAVNSIKTQEGEWREFGRAVLNRKPPHEVSTAMGKVTGIGGVFLKSRGDASELSAWYRKHLGMSLEDFGGSVLQWEEDKAEDKGLTVWHVAESTSKWFSPSDSSFMINYRVDDLETMLDQFRSSGIDILQGPEYHENGVFAWIMDPDGNKVELWEPKIWDDANKK